MSFRILGLDPSPFEPLFRMSDTELKKMNVLRMIVKSPNTAPDRIELRDAAVGESVLLLNHQYLDSASPYKGSHAIYVREGATSRYDQVDDVPEAIRTRLMSLRSFTAEGMMVDADIVEGIQITGLIERLLSDARVDFIHAHHARRGCYAARIERASLRASAPSGRMHHPIHLPGTESSPG